MACYRGIGGAGSGSVPGREDLTAGGGWARGMSGCYDPVAYALESPAYNRLAFDAKNTFSGWVFYYGAKRVTHLAVSREGRELGVFPVDLPREDISCHVPHLPGAKQCGFRFDLYVDSRAAAYDFEIVYAEGTREFFVSYDIAAALRMKARFERMNRLLDAIPVPDGDLVYITQGHRDVSVYRDSSICGAANLMTYLAETGVDTRGIEAVLDFGCGTGRLLVGCHVANQAARLFGCDLNPRLVGWARRNLPKGIEVCRTGLHPPLPYDDRQFDIVYLVSVFTHLSLPTQQRWVREFKRVLKPGGYLVVTLHGEFYARHSFWNEPEKMAEFHTVGYLERAYPIEGSNYFTTYHDCRFAGELFEDFELRGYFPNGRAKGRRTLFQIAQAQDVYVFQCRGAGAATGG